MKGLREKIRKNEGFTLVEMLIVVAIIAILIAVSIPMVNNALEKSRHAVDQANVRDAIALATIEYLADSEVAESGKKFGYVVDKNSKGALGEANDANVTPKCTCGGVPTDALTVEIDKDGKTTTNWHFNGTQTVTGDANTPVGGGG